MLILYFLNSGDVEYDDEYDDTYDTNAMGENEPDAMELREFVLPRALGGGHVTGSRQKGRGNTGSEEESDEDGDKPVRLEFVRNPEEIRQVPFIYYVSAFIAQNLIWNTKKFRQNVMFKKKFFCFDEKT